MNWMGKNMDSNAYVPIVFRFHKVVGIHSTCLLFPEHLKVKYSFSLANLIG